MTDSAAGKSYSQAVATLKRKVLKMTLAEEKSAEARREWEDAVLEAQMAGCTYPQIAALSGKSRIRIDQVIRSQRLARGIPTNQKENA